MTRRKRIVLIAAGLLAAYVGSYAILSACGDWYWSQTGKTRYKDMGLAVSDVERWFPAWAHWEPFHTIGGEDTSRGDTPGYLYSPLIRLDRAWLHRDRPVFPATAPAVR